MRVDDNQLLINQTDADQGQTAMAAFAADDLRRKPGGHEFMLLVREMMQQSEEINHQRHKLHLALLDLLNRAENMQEVALVSNALQLWAELDEMTNANNAKLQRLSNMRRGLPDPE